MRIAANDGVDVNFGNFILLIRGEFRDPHDDVGETMKINGRSAAKSVEQRATFEPAQHPRGFIRTDRGQVHGGIAQGVGQALFEGAHYNDDGQLLTASYMDYCMPRADNLPSFTIDSTETLCPSNPLGIKGCGEAGAIASTPAVINAITDAVGHENVTMPATAQVVWRAAQKAVLKRAAE